MTWQHLSSGAHPQRNDDHVAVFRTLEHTDLLVIDGATSVAGRDHIAPVEGDVAWFVRAFAASVGQLAGSGRSQHDMLNDAVDAVRTRFDQAVREHAIPVHAWPIAALTWVRIGERAGRPGATLYSLGDCKTLLRLPDGAVVDPDPFFNPQETVLQAEIARLRSEGVIDPAERHARMLPMLRARREAQNLAPAPTILCAQPRGPFQARTCSFDLAPGTALLVMTDGFYRLVEPYGLYTEAELFAQCEARGLASMLDVLRSCEQAGSDSAARAVKAADDASAALWVAR